MTGEELYNEALKLLGYTEENGNVQLTARVMSRTLTLLNLVINDLRRVSGKPYKKIKSLAEDIDLPDNILEIAACGLAGYVAGAEGDDTNQYFWSSEYTARRTTLTSRDRIIDRWE